MRQESSKELKWLFQEGRPFVKFYIASLGCSAIASVVTLADPLIMKWLIDDILPSRQKEWLTVAAFALFCTFIGQYLFAGLSGQITFHASQRMAFRLRRNVFRHLLGLSSGYYDKTPVGDLHHRLQHDVDQVAKLTGNCLIYFFRLLMVSALVLITMFALNATLTLVSLPLIPAFLLIRKIHHERLKHSSEVAEDRAGELSSFIETQISAITQIQLLCRQLMTLGHFSRLAITAMRSETARIRKEFSFFILSMFIVIGGISFLLAYGGQQVIGGTLSIGGLVAFYSLLIRLFEPLSNAVEMTSKLHRINASIRRILEIIETKTAINDHSRARDLPLHTVGEIKFKNVHFGYVTDKKVLSGFNIKIDPGEKVALIGVSGSGKTTIAKLTARLYDVWDGTVTVGGYDIRDIKLKSLRQNVCLLPQDPILLGKTLRESVTYGNCKVSELELEEIAELSQLDMVVKRLSRGWDSPIGPRGAMLSGGERQRVALARAILQKPRILILDEFTSGLDIATERELLEAMNNQMKDMTVLIISHRTSTILWADRIVLLTKGQSVDEIPFTSLLQKDGTYGNIFDDQFVMNAGSNGKRRKRTGTERQSIELTV